MSERNAHLSRRNFLLTLGAGGAAAAILAKTSGPPSSASDKEKRASRGYRVTEHVNNYYRTTKV
jgi:hypothetical protein